jgi:hypothetical protein
VQWDRTALHVACENMNVSLAEKLILSGADINMKAKPGFEKSCGVRRHLLSTVLVDEPAVGTFDFLDPKNKSRLQVKLTCNAIIHSIDSVIVGSI